MTSIPALGFVPAGVVPVLCREILEVASGFRDWYGVALGASGQWNRTAILATQIRPSVTRLESKIDALRSLEFAQQWLRNMQVTPSATLFLHFTLNLDDPLRREIIPKILSPQEVGSHGAAILAKAQDVIHALATPTASEKEMQLLTQLSDVLREEVDVVAFLNTHMDIRDINSVVGFATAIRGGQFAQLINTVGAASPPMTARLRQEILTVIGQAPADAPASEPLVTAIRVHWEALMTGVQVFLG